MKQYREKKAQEKKQEPKPQVHKRYTNNRAKWTVHYIKTEGGYVWQAFFRNPVTDRLVKFESGREFATILMAQKDYTAATR